MRKPADGPPVGVVRWDAVPEALFELEVTADGRLTRFTMYATDAGTVTARRLRRAPIGAMERAVRQKVRERAAETVFLGDLLSSTDDEDLASRASQLKTAALRVAADFRERPRPGAAGRGDPHYAMVAALCIDRFNAGDPHPAASVAKTLNLSPNTVRNLLYKARERGLATSLGRGRPGGQLTDKGREALRGQHQATF
ncbi:MAG: hypothetical protein ACLGIO_04460 [Acidimicrobiia bacterium]